MKHLLEFTDKNIVIDGAGRGIGLETACLLNRLGANVILIDSNTEVLDDAVNTIGNQRCSA